MDSAEAVVDLTIRYDELTYAAALAALMGELGYETTAAAERDFAKRGVTRISLTTRLKREDAHRSYEQLGYAKNGFRYAKELTGTGD